VEGILRHMISDSYKTVRKETSAEFTEKKSVFIGYIRPIDTENDANDFIREISHKNASATHNVFAYISREGNAARYSDAGEPQGTAGMPAFEVLKREELTGVCVVITRYFGGILLGAGGLVRAYARSCAMAVEASGICIYRRHLTLSLEADYSFAGKLNYELPKRGAVGIETEFGEKVLYRFMCLPESLIKLEGFVSDVSSGQLTLNVTGERFAPED